MLSSDGGQGGVGGFIAKFQRAGLGNVVGSRVDSGQNQPVSGEQFTDVLGADTMAERAERAELAEKLGTSQGVQQVGYPIFCRA